MKRVSKCSFLLAAFLSFLLSVGLWFLGDPAVAKQQGIFVGLWVPSILALGNYFVNCGRDCDGGDP